MGGAPMGRGRRPLSCDLHYPVPLSCNQSSEAAQLQSVLTLGVAPRRGSSLLREACMGDEGLSFLLLSYISWLS
jgi:hypothetical protein